MVKVLQGVFVLSEAKLGIGITGLFMDLSMGSD